MLCAHDGAVQALLADIDGAASAARAQRPGRAPPQGKYLHMHRVRATSRVGAAAGQLPAHSGRGAQPRGLPAAGAGRQAGRHAGRFGRRPRVCHPEVPAPARLPREKAGKGGNKAPWRQTDCSGPVLARRNAADSCRVVLAVLLHSMLAWSAQQKAQGHRAQPHAVAQGPAGGAVHARADPHRVLGHQPVLGCARPRPGRPARSPPTCRCLPFKPGWPPPGWGHRCVMSSEDSGHAWCRALRAPPV